MTNKFKILMKISITLRNSWIRMKSAENSLKILNLYRTTNLRTSIINNQFKTGSQSINMSQETGFKITYKRLKLNIVRISQIITNPERMSFNHTWIQALYQTEFLIFKIKVLKKTWEKIAKSDHQQNKRIRTFKFK